jgi:chromosome condensin MukBEF ATPase and DNA-binding subunit MukB
MILGLQEAISADGYLTEITRDDMIDRIEEYADLIDAFAEEQGLNDTETQSLVEAAAPLMLAMMVIPGSLRSSVDKGSIYSMLEDAMVDIRWVESAQFDTGDIYFPGNP